VTLEDTCRFLADRPAELRSRAAETTSCHVGGGGALATLSTLPGLAHRMGGLAVSAHLPAAPVWPIPQRHFGDATRMQFNWRRVVVTVSNGFPRDDRG
jgi:hypothetical protein